MKPFFAGNFSHRAFGCEIAMQNNQMAVLFNRVVEGVHDILRFRIGFHLRQILRQGFAGDGHAIAMQQACLK